MNDLIRKFIFKSYLRQILLSFIVGVFIVYTYNMIAIRPAPKIRLMLLSLGLGAIFSILSGILNCPNLLIKKSGFKKFLTPILIFSIILILSFFIAKYYVDSSILIMIVPITFLNIIYNSLMILIIKNKTAYNKM